MAAAAAAAIDIMPAPAEVPGGEVLVAPTVSLKVEQHAGLKETEMFHGTDSR
jgi:hypothetical protein